MDCIQLLAACMHVASKSLTTEQADRKIRFSDPKNSKVSLEPLRQHPSLQYITIGYGPYRPMAEFWAEYDAQQAAGKK